MGKKRRARQATPTVSETVDRELAAKALEKRRRGEKPLQAELRALRRVEKAREDADRWRYYESIPKGHWLEMCGRQARTVNSQARTYGAPLGGRVIDLRALAAWVHDFLAENARKLAGTEDDDPLMNGAVSPWLERYRREKTLLARLKRREQSRELIRRDEIHDGLARVAAFLREAGARLQREFGEEARIILDEALDDAQRELDGVCGSGRDVDGDVPDELTPK